MTPYNSLAQAMLSVDYQNQASVSMTDPERCIAALHGVALRRRGCCAGAKALLGRNVASVALTEQGARQMRSLDFSRYALSSCVLVAMLAGCGSNAPSARLMPVGSAYRTSQNVFDGGAAPPKCKGQTPVPHGAQVSEHISRRPDVLCVPSLDGFGGELGFPGARPPGPINLIVESKHYLKLGKLKAIFTLQWLPGWQFSFGPIAPPGGITGKKIIPGETYTAYGQYDFDGGHTNVGPCYSVASRGQYGGVFKNLGSLMEKRSGSFFVWTLGIYPGKDAKSRC